MGRLQATPGPGQGRGAGPSLALSCPCPWSFPTRRPAQPSPALPNPSQGWASGWAGPGPGLGEVLVKEGQEWARWPRVGPRLGRTRAGLGASPGWARAGQAASSSHALPTPSPANPGPAQPCPTSSALPSSAPIPALVLPCPALVLPCLAHGPVLPCPSSSPAHPCSAKPIPGLGWAEKGRAKNGLGARSATKPNPAVPSRGEAKL